MNLKFTQKIGRPVALKRLSIGALILMVSMIVMVHGTAAAYPTSCSGSGWCISLNLSDSMDSASRYWAVFYNTAPGSYQGGGQWANSATCNQEPLSSGNTMYCFLPGSGDEIYTCVSVPSSGYGTYSGLIKIYESGTYQGEVYVSSITESSCSESLF